MNNGAGTLLRGTWFAADIPIEVGRRLSELGVVEDYAAGQVVVREGLPCRALGIVLHGRIALRLTVPGIGDRTILTIDEGDVFGWSALLPDAVATSTGVALLPSRAIVFPSERLVPAMASDCALAAAVHERVLAAVARRLSATRLQLLDLYGSGVEPW